MGKHRDKVVKRKQRRPRPTDVLPSVEEAEMDAELNQHEHDTGLLPVIIQLSSQEAEDREYACSSLTHLLAEEEEEGGQGVLATLLEQGVIKKLLQNLCDPVSIEVRISAAGALRNLSVTGFEACEHMVEKDCMTLLLSALQQTYTKLTSDMGDTSEAAEERKFLNVLMTQVMHLLSNLSESSEIATNSITKNNSILGATYFLRTDLFPLELAIATAEFLSTVTDDNPPVSKQLTSSTVHIQQLRDMFVNPNTNDRLRAYVAGILFNVSTNKTIKDTINTIFPFLIKCIDFDGLGNLLNAEQYFPTICSAQNISSLLAPQKAPYADLIDSWNNSIQAQQYSLELLTNICSGADSDEEINLSKDLIQLLVSSLIPSKLMNKCESLPAERRQQLQQLNLNDFLLRFEKVQARALAALGNIVLALPTEALGDITPLWGLLCQICVEINALDVLDNATGIMWSILRKFPHFEPATSHIEGLVQFSKYSLSEDVRDNCVGMLGIIAQQPKSASISMDLANLFLDLLGDSSLLVIAEALNSIFDNYAEPPANEIVKMTEMLPKLMKCLQNVRSKIKAERGHLALDVLIRVEEAEINLTRFLEYKYEQLR